jgi:hypothetical protein
LPNSDDYTSWNRAARAEENRQLKQLMAEWSATAAEFGQTNASGGTQKKL